MRKNAQIHNMILYKVKSLQGYLWNFQENSFWKRKCYSVLNEIRFNDVNCSADSCGSQNLVLTV